MFVPGLCEVQQFMKYMNVLAVWNELTNHFGNLYQTLFQKLNSPQFEVIVRHFAKIGGYFVESFKDFIVLHYLLMASCLCIGAYLVSL